MKNAHRLLLLAIAAIPSLAGAQEAAPKNGTEVLERMRAAYEGKWYHTLTFGQKTTTFRNGEKRVQSWHEYLRHTAKGTQLRIDFGDASKGNGVLYTPDSAFRFQNGKLAGKTADGNAFLPLIEGVYVQPVAKTVAELAQTKVDLGRMYVGTWKSKPVWVVGATSVADSTSPQFWIDPAQKVILRMVMKFSGPDPLDVVLDDYVQAGNGMLATKVTMSVKGSPVQIEDYADWKVDVTLPDSLFDINAWVQP
jgi:outer membrane lipoprotein-sorting protein